MKARFVLSLAALTMVGCVSVEMPRRLAPLTGRNIKAAIDVLGYPTQEGWIAGDHVYVWDSRGGSVAVAVPVGRYGAMAYAGQYFCTIKLGTDEAGTIKHTEWAGNIAGCQGYLGALSRLWQ